MTDCILSKHPFASAMNYTFVGLCHESDPELVK